MCFCWLRFQVLALTTLCLTAIYSNIVIMNFTKNCMIQRYDTGDNWLQISPSVGHQRQVRSINTSELFNEIIKPTPLELDIENKCNDSLYDCVSNDQIAPNEQTKSSTTTHAPKTEQTIDVVGSLVGSPENINGTETRCVLFRWTDLEESILLSAVGLGALLALFPVCWLMHRFGARIVFTIFGCLSALSTAFVPLVLLVGNGSASFWAMLAVRICQGIAFSACIPTIAEVTNNWAPLNEYALFLVAMGSFVQIAPSLTYPIAGLFCNCSLLSGWPAVHWIFAAITLVLMILWTIFYRNYPQKHPWRDGQELYNILSGKGPIAKTRGRSTPAKAIFGSGAVWAVWAAALGNMCAVQLLIIYTPTFLKHVLNYAPTESGFTAALPTLVMLGVKAMAGFASYVLKIRSDTCKVRVFNSIAFLGTAAFLGGLGFVSVSHVSAALLICAAAILGFNSGGFYMSAVLVAKQYSVFVICGVEFLLCVAMLIEPFVVAAVVPSSHWQHSTKWRVAFVAHCVLLIVTNFAFCFMESAVAAKWAQSSKLAGDDNDNESLEPGIISMEMQPPPKRT